MSAGWREVPPATAWGEMEERVLEFWRERDVFQRSLERAGRRRALGLLRGPADRQRPPRLPPRALARVQGHLPPLPDHARALRRPARRLGLPRPAGRARGGEAPRHLGQAPDRGLRHRRVQRALPRVGADLPRRVGAPHRAHRLLDRHRPGLPHDGHRLRRERLVEPRRALPAAACSTAATRSCPTARAAAPRCRATRSPWATRTSTTPRSTSASRWWTASESLLVWTTTPWTLPANQAAAINPDVTYAAVEHGDETLIMAEPLVARGARRGRPRRRA